MRGYALVLFAATSWATLGLFYKQLIDGYGLTPTVVAFFRALCTALILFSVFVGRWLLRGRRDRLFPTIRTRRDWVHLAVFGLFGIAAFYIVYANAVDRAGVGVAAVLMYTAPAWVTVISALFLDEAFSRIKGIALVLSIAGTALVARVYALGDQVIDPWGIVFGLGAGLTYGLYTLFSKVNVQRHEPWTVVAWALAFGSLFMLPVQDMAEIGYILHTPEALLWIVAMAVGPTLLGGVSFTMGVQTIPASNASIIATLEPVIATVLGWLLLDEHFDWPQLAGAVLIVSAVILLSRGSQLKALGRFNGGARRVTVSESGE